MARIAVAFGVGLVVGQTGATDLSALPPGFDCDRYGRMAEFAYRYASSHPELYGRQRGTSDVPWNPAAWDAATVEVARIGAMPQPLTPGLSGLITRLFGAAWFGGGLYGSNAQQFGDYAGRQCRDQAKLF